MNIETLALRAGYQPENGQPHVLPIYQSTTFEYPSAEYLGQLFDLSAPGHMYSRISNPTVEKVEEKIAAMEGGVAAVMTSSGQMANMIALLNIMNAGDHCISTGTIYGGTTNLFAVTLKRFGIEVEFVDADLPESEIDARFRPNTRCVFGETLANPAMVVLDIEKFARTAHRHGVPLIVDNTFATPVLCRPFEYGADIVTHSTTKYMDGHAIQVGGVVVDSGNFDWDNGKFPELTEPDASYHGVVYTKNFGKAAYATKARVQLTRDFGTCPPAISAFLLNLGLETLPLRMERHCQNAEVVADYLNKSDKVEFVNYPALEGHPQKALKDKYLPKGCSGVVSFELKGGRQSAMNFIDALEMASNVVHVADIRTLVIHPASTTHRQLTDEQLVQSGVKPGLIRLSVGCEHIDDILADLRKALAKA